MIYRTDLFEASGIEVPTTLEEMLAAGEQLKADNADVANFSGIYLPGPQLARGACRSSGRTAATSPPRRARSGSASSTRRSRSRGSSSSSRCSTEANAAPADGDDANDWLAFCAGEVGMMPAPGWKPGQIINPDDGCPEMEANIGVFAMPGLEAGTTAPVFLGGSNLGIPTNSENQELALDLLKIMVSAGFQQQFAEVGHDPGAQVRARQRGRQRRRRRPGRGGGEQPLRADQREVGRRRGGQRPARTC